LQSANNRKLIEARNSRHTTKFRSPGAVVDHSVNDKG